MQSVPINTNVLSLNLSDGEVYSVQHYWFLRYNINIVESGVKHHKPNQNIIKKKQIWRYYKGYWNCKSLKFYDGQTTHWMAKKKKDKKINNDPSNIAQKRTDWTIRTSQKPPFNVLSVRHKILMIYSFNNPCSIFKFVFS
jgi:hypothetical protein